MVNGQNVTATLDAQLVLNALNIIQQILTPLRESITILESLLKFLNDIATTLQNLLLSILQGNSAALNRVTEIVNSLAPILTLRSILQLAVNLLAQIQLSVSLFANATAPVANVLGNVIGLPFTLLGALHG